MPDEWADFLLMKRMHWSWEQLQATPWYVRRYTLDFLSMAAEHEERQADRERRKKDRQARMG